MSTTSARSTRDRLGAPDPAALLLAALVGSVILALFPVAHAPKWSPRAMLYLAAIPWGAAALWRLVRSRDRLAVAACGFLAVAVAAALASPAPWRSILPSYHHHDGVAIWLAAFGAWALLRERPDDDRRVVEYGFVGAVAFSVLIGVVQLAIDIRTGPLATNGGRAEGLSLNPVYLGSLSAGAAAWWTHAALRAAATLPRWLVSAGLASSATGVWISGSRIALVALVGVVVAILVRSRALGLRSVVAPMVAGFAAGQLVRWINRSVAGGGARSPTDRLGAADVAAGFGLRFDMWRFDLRAILSRPLLGHGPGSHANALQPHFDADHVARADPDALFNNWSDAHNIVLGLLVTVGVVGLVAAAVFFVLQVRDSRGPAAWAVAAIVIPWLLQPASMVTLIPALALAGAAGSQPAERPRPSGTAKVAIGSATVLLSVWFLGAELMLDRADELRTIESAEQVASWWWHDPLTAWEATVLGLREANRSRDVDDRARVLDLARRITDRDPSLSFWWVQRGDIERILDRDVDARRSYERALEVMPWSYDAHSRLSRLATDPERLAEIDRRLRVLDARIAEQRP